MHNCDLNVFINNQPLKFVSSHKYLGNIVCETFKDDADIAQKQRGLYMRGNMLLKNFSNCTDDVKCKLFKSYCSSFYCCQTWNMYKSETIRRLKVAYNNVFRQLMKLAPRTSMSYAMSTCDINHFNVIYRKSINCFNNRLSLSSNILVKTVIESLYFMNGNMFKTWPNILYMRCISMSANL